MEKFKIVRVFEDGIYDFKNVILPNVWEQLLITEAFDDYGIVLIGALNEEGKPIGCIAARLLEKAHTFIDSIYVSEDYRRKRVATEMFDTLLSVSLETFDISSGTKPTQTAVFVQTEYALPFISYISLRRFLQKVGFTDFLKKPSTYMLESDEMKKIWEEKVGLADTSRIAVYNLNEVVAGGSDILYDFFSEMDVAVEPSYCFFSGEPEDPRYMVFAEYSDESDFFITSAAFSDDISLEEFATVQKVLTERIGQDYESFTLIYNGEKNAEIGYFDAIRDGKGLSCDREEAGMYIVFE